MLHHSNVNFYIAVIYVVKQNSFGTNLLKTFFLFILEFLGNKRFSYASINLCWI
jgi:hypothetical protein